MSPCRTPLVANIGFPKNLFCLGINLSFVQICSIMVQILGPTPYCCNNCNILSLSYHRYLCFNFIWYYKYYSTWYSTVRYTVPCIFQRSDFFWYLYHHYNKYHVPVPVPALPATIYRSKHSNTITGTVPVVTNTSTSTTSKYYLYL
jgi:hypothetical protein